MSYDEAGPPPQVIEAWAKDCRCCRECDSDVPCPGVCAGGVCDHACRCDDEFEDCCDDEPAIPTPRSRE